MTKALDELFSADQVSRTPDELAHYGTDWTRAYRVAPSAVVFPTSTEQVVALVKLANHQGLSLVPSGGRTGLSGGAVASAGEVVVSFDRMNRMGHFRPSEQVVTCEAGTVTAALQAFAKEQGLFYPVDFASAGSSQIGGNIATNAGGIKVIRYGLTRDWVAGLRVVTGSGELIDCNHALIKNATGYDLRHLFIGSEGTLGFIVEADMRLISPPPPQTVMVLGVPDIQSVMPVLDAFKGHLTLSAFEFFSELALSKVVAHRGLQRPFASRTPFYTLLEFDEDGMDQATEIFADLLDKKLVVDAIVSQSQAQAQSLWQLREGISESIAPQTPYKNDLSVRVTDVPLFLTAVDALVAAEYPDLEVCWYGHIGDGNLHLNILCPPDLDKGLFFERCHGISPGIFQIVQTYGGSISAEHGVGLLKKEFLNYSRSEAEIQLMRALKSVFDPHQIMNPGKLFSD